MTRAVKFGFTWTGTCEGSIVLTLRIMEHMNQAARTAMSKISRENLHSEAQLGLKASMDPVLFL